MSIPVIGGLFSIGEKLIERLWPDPAQRDKAKLELLSMERSGELSELQTRMQSIVAEAQGESWLQRNWRPITMLCFVFVIMNNFVLIPYARLFGFTLPVLDLPTDIWSIIELGLGGYVIGRSGEKIAKSVADAVVASKS